jgi:MFS family permease
MFMDISSESVHALLPLFLVGTLGAGVGLVGLIEGVAEATSAIVKVFSGWLSDRLGRRKLLAVLGYGLGAVSKPVFPLAATPFEVLAARFVDRVGKGLRGAPRDALVADLAPPEARGAAFGLRQGLDTTGALAGPALAMVLLAVLGDVRKVFAWAVVPAVAAVLLLVLGVEDPRGAAAPVRRPGPIDWARVAGMGGAFWTVTAVGVVFTLARFSEAFLILRARDVGLPMALAPAVMVVMNLVYALASAPAGRLSDRVDRRALLAAGLVSLIVADLVLARLANLAGLALGAGLWGLHMGLTQGVLAALVADAAPADLRGTAFGVFNLASGLALLAASVIAGALWSAHGPQATFEIGAAFAALALAGLALVIRRRPARR